jgi:hypothetical protein
MKMLWYKAWLETRWRMLMPLIMILFLVYTAHSIGDRRPAGVRAPTSNVLQIFWMIAPLTLAGSGIATEAVFQAKKGLHGSMYFTLGLPVSRLRLFAVRVAVGMLETFALVLAEFCIAAIMIPGAGGGLALADGLPAAATLLLCTIGFYGLSTLFSTFFDQLWQIWGSMIAFFVLAWISDKFKISPALDVFRAIAGASPIGPTHAAMNQMPWTAIAVSLCAGAAFMLAALRVVQTKEY